MPAQRSKRDGLTAAEGSISSRPTSSNDNMSDTQATRPDTGNISMFNSSFVTIAVGPNKIKFFVHEQALAQPKAGQFFNRVFTSGFQAQTKHLELPEDDPVAFDVFVNWLYESCRFGAFHHRYYLEDNYTTGILQSYILAHKYLIDGFQDSITSVLYDRMQQCSWSEMDIDRNTLEKFLVSVPDSNMHRLLARCFIYSALHPAMSRELEGIAIDSAVDDLPEEFVRLMMKEMFKVQGPCMHNEFEFFCGSKREYLLRGD